jgi:hypothetical protein
MGQSTSKMIEEEKENCNKQIQEAKRAYEIAKATYGNTTNLHVLAARRKLKEKETCEKPDPRILQTWKKAENANKWPNPNPTGGAPQYVVLGDGRKRRVILTNRKKYVKVKGEHVPLKIAQKMFK